MLFRSYRKRKALESYQTVLRQRLRGTYGKRDHYEPYDVVSTARTYRLSETYLCYALAMYCDRASFDAYHAEQGDAACSYERLWHELHATVHVSDGSMNLSAMTDATATHDENVIDGGGDACDSPSFDLGFDGGGGDCGGGD
jgi:hypothetical protein